MTVFQKIFAVLCFLTAISGTILMAGTARAYDLPTSCYPPDKVMEIERAGSTAVAHLDKDQVGKLIPVLITRFKFEPWIADTALVFLRPQSVEIVYFINGCATLQTDLSPSSWKEVAKEAFGTGA